MKKLDVRFDDKVNKKLETLANYSGASKSEAARAAMNIGLIRLQECADNLMIDLIEDNK